MQRHAALAAVAGLTTTVAVATVPFLRFTYVSSASRVAMDTAQFFIACTVAYLLHGRFRRSGRRSELLLVFALGVSAAGNLVNVVVRAATEDHTSLSPFGTWSGRGIGLVAAAAFASAGWLSDRDVRGRWARGWHLPALLIATVGGVCLIVGLAADQLPDSTKRIASAASSARPALETDRLLLVVNALLLGLFVAAALGMVRRSGHTRSDALLSAVSTGLVLAAVARLNFVLYPSMYTDVVHTGDALRLSFYLVLLVGAEREIRAYWRDRAQVAVLDERRRIARELHDGVTQELSFIRSQVRSFERRPAAPEMLDFVASAAERALTESRRAIVALSDTPDEALDIAVRRAVADVADRAGLEVVFELAPDVSGGPAGADIVRIAREATTNVAKHASARTLRVSLARRGNEVRMLLEDDGAGFDPDASRPGFGLRSMRERAEAIGGRLTVGRGESGGTRIVLSVPAAGHAGREPDFSLAGTGDVLVEDAHEIDEVP